MTDTIDEDIAAWQTMDAELSSFLEALLDLRGPQRTATMLEWFRSPAWHPAAMLAEGVAGALFREAYETFRREYDGDSPAMVWRRADMKAGRKAIYRALKIDPADRTAFYACFPFRILKTAEDETWIGGAVGCPRLFKADLRDPCPELDISDVILWNPKTGALRLLGETGPSFLTPYQTENRLTVYIDGFSFFRAWAERRSEVAGLHLATVAGAWAHGQTEPRDGNIPGALVIGDITKAPVPLDVAVLEAGPGVDAKLLIKAVYRQANLPRVQPRKAA